MPRKKTLWFRFYVEAIHDRKLRRQPPATRWLWVVVLALARKSPVPGTLLLAVDGGEDDPIELDDLVDEAALPRRDVAKGMAEFERLGMLDRNDDGAWVVAKWGERQFESDDTTARTRKHRSKEQGGERRRNVPTTPGETTSSHARGTGASHAVATEAEAETDQEEERATRHPTWTALAERCPARQWGEVGTFGAKARLLAALTAVEDAGWPPDRAADALLAGDLSSARSVGAVLLSRAETLAATEPPPLVEVVDCRHCRGSGLWWSDDGKEAVQCMHPDEARTA